MRSLPWGEEEPQSAVVRAPSWVAPRRQSLLPLAMPRSSAPPRIVEVNAEVATPPPAVHSVPPGAHAIPPKGPSVAPPREDPAAAAQIAELQATVAQLEAQLVEAAAAIAEMRRAVLAECEPDVVVLACAIAERAVGRELRADPELHVRWAREGLSTLGDPEDATVAVGAALHEAIAAEAWRNAFPAPVVLDPQLAPWRCEVRAGGSRVRADREARVAAIVEALDAKDA